MLIELKNSEKPLFYMYLIAYLGLNLLSEGAHKWK